MSKQEVRDDKTVQDAVRNLFNGAAPERAREIQEFWELLSPKFQLTGDLHKGDRLIMDAGAFRYVRFNHRVLRAFWVASFAAWEAYRAVANCSAISDINLRRFRELIAEFNLILSRKEPTEAPLPLGIAEPGNYPDRETDPEGRAAAELATIAVGWALLHEVRHLKHQQSGTCADPNDDDPKERHAEELSCDAFATNFLINRADECARDQKVAVEQVIRKRQIGIYFGLFALTLLAQGKWDASSSHPALQTRFDQVRTLLASTTPGIAEAIAHSAFAALRTLWPNAPRPF